VMSFVMAPSGIKYQSFGGTYRLHHPAEGVTTDKEKYTHNYQHLLLAGDDKILASYWPSDEQYYIHVRFGRNFYYLEQDVSKYNG